MSASGEGTSTSARAVSNSSERMIQLTRQGTQVTADPEELTELAGAFARQHYLRLPSLIEPGLLDQVGRELEQVSFGEHFHAGGTEQKLLNMRITGLLNFLANNRTLFQAIQTVTSCGVIGCFVGRVYRMAPTREHYGLWHDDSVHGRLIALSINLSPDKYSGGVLQLRERSSRRIIAEIPNTGWGDCVIFRIADSLEHRITNVSGKFPKIAFAGWFKSRPDYFTELMTNEKGFEGELQSRSQDHA